MDTIIIGQGYNLKEDTSVGKELIEQFESNRYKSYTLYKKSERKWSADKSYPWSRSKGHLKGSFGGSFVLGGRFQDIPHTIRNNIPSKSLFI